MSRPSVDATPEFVPPRIASRVIRFVLPEDDRPALLGDLQEAFDLRARAGSPAAARRWYRSQALRSVWPALTLHADARGLLRMLGGLFVGFATLWIVGDAALVGSRAGYAALFPADPPPETVLRLTYLGSMIPSCAFAGMLAARSGGDVGRLAAVALGALLVVPVLIAPLLSHGGDPLWARLIWIATAPAATILGSSIGQPSRGRRT